MRQTLYDFCRENGKDCLLAEWDAEKNGTLTPRDVSYGSNRRPWWRCKKDHSWQTSVYTRMRGTGCPYCAGKKVGCGNDLTSRYPTLAQEWDTEKNTPLTPSEVSAGSQRMVWWRCEKGHSYRSQVRSRTRGVGCPVCAGRKVLPGENDLATTYPLLVREWDAEKNGALTPTEVSSGSPRQVWWRCEKSHSWHASISSRARGCGCPVCSGKKVLPGENDLASCYPELTQEWDTGKNRPLTPQAVTPASNRKVWWRCPLGHSYAAVIADRATRDHGCPYCAGRKVLAGFNDLATKDPVVAGQWHPTRNGSFTPKMVTTGSHRKIWWLCEKGHAWKAVVYSRTGGHRCGCPVCAGRVSAAHRPRYEQLIENLVTKH